MTSTYLPLNKGGGVSGATSAYIPLKKGGGGPTPSFSPSPAPLAPGGGTTSCYMPLNKSGGGAPAGAVSAYMPLNPSAIPASPISAAPSAAPTSAPAPRMDRTQYGAAPPGMDKKEGATDGRVEGVKEGGEREAGLEKEVVDRKAKMREMERRQKAFDQKLQDLKAGVEALQRNVGRRLTMVEAQILHTQRKGDDDAIYTHHPFQYKWNRQAWAHE